MLNDCRIKVAELALKFGISKGSVYAKVHEHLGLTKEAQKHARSRAMSGAKSRTSGGVQCQCRRFLLSSCNRRSSLASTLGPKY